MNKTKHPAATASPDWIYARNQYIDHLMTCRACYAPVERFCATGQVLRQQYSQTPTPQENIFAEYPVFVSATIQTGST